MWIRYANRLKSAILFYIEVFLYASNLPILYYTGSSYEIDDGYEIIIEDNGVGFDTAAIDWDDGTHIGIANARERLKYFCNGTITIRSSLGNGTLAKIFIPREKVNE